MCCENWWGGEEVANSSGSVACPQLPEPFLVSHLFRLLRLEELLMLECELSVLIELLLLLLEFEHPVRLLDFVLAPQLGRLDRLSSLFEGVGVDLI